MIYDENALRNTVGAPMAQSSEEDKAKVLMERHCIAVIGSDAGVVRDPRHFYAEIVQALTDARRQQREADAQIAEAHDGHGAWCADASGDCQELTVKAIAAAIRGEVK